MKKDIDSLMQTRNLDALLVQGHGTHNPPMVYLTGGANLTFAILLKKRGELPILFHRSMERDEAALTSLPTRNLDDYNWEELLKQAGGNPLEARVARLKKILKDANLDSGRLAIYGQGDTGDSYALFTALQAALPQLELVGETDNNLLLAAMSTKDIDEVARIRRIGQITTTVMSQVIDFLTTQRVKKETLVHADGTPVTIGDVKRRINLWLVERDAENPDETIFTIGRDAGVPHTTGNPKDALRLGQTIIFDIFPCEKGGGYFYDITRTWCLGYAPPAAQALYEDVLQAYHNVMSELQVGMPLGHFQELTCRTFQSRGHKTKLDTPGTLEGYVHGLGHGVGLHIHEQPFFQLNTPETARLEANNVITVEPGLYYPERGLGVRLEDTIWMRPDGLPEVLSPFPHDLILPVRS